MFTFGRIMKLVQFRIFFLASLSFCLFLIIFFWFFFSSSSSSSFQKKQKALASPTTTTTQKTQRKNNNKRKSNRSNHHQNQNARRATIGRVLRRTRERARREAIERDRSSSGGEHREEQFRTRWVGQGIRVKILFSRGKKSTLASRWIVFFSLSLC